MGRNEREYVNSKGIVCHRSIEECEETYDVITMFYVLEHLQDPEGWLKKCGSNLTESGLLIIEVLHADDAFLSLYENEKFADFTYWSAHLFYSA